jgi:hypothetical protein
MSIRRDDELVVFTSTCLVTVTPQCDLLSEMLFVSFPILPALGLLRLVSI